MAGIISTTIKEGNIAVQNREVVEELLGNNEFEYNKSYTASGDTILLSMLLLGKIVATGKIVKLDPTASTGAEQPYGFLWLGLEPSVTILNGVTNSNLTVVTKGKVDESTIALPTGVTLDDTVTGTTRTVRDFLSDRGFTLVTCEEQTSFTHS
jgi:hypothetical protein